MYLEAVTTLNFGVWGELTDYFLTDSTSFRSKIGSDDEHQFTNVEILKDSIFVVTYEREVLKTDTLDEVKFDYFLKSKYPVKNGISLNLNPVFGINKIINEKAIDSCSYIQNNNTFLVKKKYKDSYPTIEAEYLTDKKTYNIFIGIPNSSTNYYETILNDKSEVIKIMNLKDSVKIDTIKKDLFSLTKLKKGSLICICK